MYNEALGRARKLKEMYPQDAPGYEEVFPELRESEDERIRKEIIDIVKSYRKNCITEGTHRFDDCLAWLEKQKEQKEIPLMNGDADLYFDNWIQHNDTTKRGCFEEGIRYAQRLQKEQNLIMANSPQLKEQWSEEDEKMIERLITRLNWITYNTRTDGTSPNITFFDEIAWLRSLRPQPKVELSEDVKKTLDEVSHILIGLNYKQIAKDYKQAVEKLLSTRN